VILSAGLLNYSGKELVNVLFFLFFVVIVPFFISLFSFLFRISEKFSALLGVFFSLGALVSLIVTISTRDIAFGWATTLDISPKEFYNFLSYFAFWKDICHECIPSQKLIEISRFSRLGGALTKQQLLSATELGQWWKFLAMSLFVYGVLFRFLIYLLSLKRSSRLVEFVSNKNEPEFKEIDSSYEKHSSAETLKGRDFRLYGYYVDIKNLNLTQNPKAKDIVIAVKSYEPPVLDFFDYLDDIIDENPNSNISLLMTGIDKPKEKDVDIWKRKLKELKYDFIEVLS
jgi:hypothetical protein